jgi:SAM-dependent methyltransferase
MIEVREFVRQTQATDLRSSVVQFNNHLTQLQYRIPYEIALRYLKPEDQALDWGCGNGHFSYFLTRQGIRTWGFSFEPLKDYLSDQPGFIFVGGSEREPTRLPFPDGKFTTVFSVGVLEHVYETGGDEVGSLKEIHRILVPGGHFLCFHFPNRFQWVEPVGRLLHLNEHFHYRKYSLADIRRLTLSGGLELLEWGRYNFFPRNQLARLPRPLISHAVPVTLFDALDAGMAHLLPFLCTNYFFVARKTAAPT